MITNIENYKYYLVESNSVVLTNESDWSKNTYTPKKLEQDIEQDLTFIQGLNLAKEQVIQYFNKILDKINKLPEQTQLKLFKIVVVSLVSLITLPQMLNSINNWGAKQQLPENKTEKLISIAKQTYDIIKPETTDTKVENKYVAPTEFSDTLVDFLKYEEGSIKHKGEPVLTAYSIGDGKVTIGYGHAEDIDSTDLVPNKTTITKQQAEDLLLQDIMEAQRGLDKILTDWNKISIKPKITQGMYDSMISMIYNMGIGNFRKSDFIQLVKRNDMKSAQAIITKTNVTYPGHKIRRAKEAQLFACTDVKDFKIS